MAYDKIVWIDNVTDLSAKNFNHMEDGIAATSEKVDIVAEQLEIVDKNKQKKLKQGLGVVLQDDGTISVLLSPTMVPNFSNKLSIVMSETRVVNISNLHFTNAVVVLDNSNYIQASLDHFEEDLMARRIDVYGYGFNITGELVTDKNSEINYVTEINFKDSDLNNLGEEALCNCARLKKLVLPETLETIGARVFAGNNSFTFVRIPEGVKTIGDECFAGCINLVSIEIPKTIETIGSNILDGCTSLANVLFDGSLTEWQALNIDVENTIVFCEYNNIAKGNVASISVNPESITIASSKLWAYPTSCVYNNKIYDLKNGIYTERGSGGGSTYTEGYGININNQNEISVDTTVIATKDDLPEAQVQSDWNVTDAESKAYIKNKPTIPAAQVQADWNESDNSKADFIKNKPTIPEPQVQANWNETNTSSKAYIQNKPTIPAAQVQADWNESDNSKADFIKNKPTIPVLPDGSATVATENGDVVTINQQISQNNGQISSNTTNQIVLGTAAKKNATTTISDNVQETSDDKVPTEKAVRRALDNISSIKDNTIKSVKVNHFFQTANDLKFKKSYGLNQEAFVSQKSLGTLTGQTSLVLPMFGYGKDIWTDGENIYLSSVNGSEDVQKILEYKEDGTPKWTTTTWYITEGSITGVFGSLSGIDVWTDGENIYFSSGPYQYEIDVNSHMIIRKTWTGLTSFNGRNVWKQGEHIYYMSLDQSYELNIATSTWTEKIWDKGGLDFYMYGSNIWTDGTDIYYSYTTNQYKLDVETNTWTPMSWTGMTDFYGENIWTDGDNIYYSYNSTHKVLNGTTWETKVWTGLASFSGTNIWTDKNNIYHLDRTCYKIDCKQIITSDNVDDSASNTKKFVSSAQLEAITANTSARHTHSNKALLDTITAIDSTPTDDSNNLVKSGGVYDAIQEVKGIAEGKNKNYSISDTTTGTDIVNTSFNSTNEIITLDITKKIVDIQNNEINLSDLKINDNVLITQTGVPDRWVAAITATEIVFYPLETKFMFDNVPTENSNNLLTSGTVYTALQGKQDELTFDNVPTQSSSNPVTSDGIYTAIEGVKTTTYQHQDFNYIYNMPVGITFGSELIKICSGSVMQICPNRWDEVTESGKLDTTDGSAVADETCLRSKNYIYVNPNINYFFVSQNELTVCCYDLNSDFVRSFTVKNTYMTLPSDTYKIKFFWTATTYHYDISVILGNEGEYVRHYSGVLINKFTGIKSTNANICDEVWETGSINFANGQNQTNANYKRSTNYFDVIPNANYYIVGKTGEETIYIFFYDYEKQFMGMPDITSGQKFMVIPANVHYIRVVTNVTASYSVSIIKDYASDYLLHTETTFTLPSDVVNLSNYGLVLSNKVCNYIDCQTKIYHEKVSFELFRNFNWQKDSDNYFYTETTGIDNGLNFGTSIALENGEKVFNCQSTSQNWPNDQCYKIVQNYDRPNHSVLMFRYDGCSTVSDFLTNLGSSILYYPLATENTTDISSYLPDTLVYFYSNGWLFFNNTNKLGIYNVEKFALNYIQNFSMILYQLEALNKRENQTQADLKNIQSEIGEISAILDNINGRVV